MKDFNIAILGCGTVGSGVAKILLDINDDISKKSGVNINLKKIVELNPQEVSKEKNIPLNLFCGNGKQLTKEEANNYINEIIQSDDIDLVVETIGGSSQYILDIVKKILQSKKHLVTANKALLALQGKDIYNTAIENNASLGFEAAVCGAIPIIKSIKESFTGDEILSISGILNGTSNYILSKMTEENLNFNEALKLAQDKGFAESDPTLDINGGDAGHKLIILIKLAFGLDVKYENLNIEGIESINKLDLDFANEIDCNIKLICHTEKRNNDIFASVRPMLVKRDNFLSQINGATNAVQVINKYSGKHILIGKGAGSLETASSIVADIVYISRYSPRSFFNYVDNKNFNLIGAESYLSPYNIIFETEDIPGITGLITTAIGNQKINIDTVGHNKHDKSKAVFSIATMACMLNQIHKAIQEIKTRGPKILLKEPKIMPILY